MEMNRRAFVTSAASAAAAGAVAGAFAGTSNMQVSKALAAESSSADEAGSESAASEQAQVSWPGEEPQIDDADIVEEIDCEILVCGAGHSGMIAGLSAATEGAKTVVIEKGATQGTTRSYIGAIDSRAQKEAGVVVDKQEAVNELVKYASGRCDQRLINMWANESGAALDWLEEQVAPYNIEMRAEPSIGDGWEGAYRRWQTHHRPILPDTLDKKPEFSETGACSTVDYWLSKLDQTYFNEALVELAQQAGADYRFSTSLVKLIVEDGAVTGAIAQSDEGYIRINASTAVILCCGGYESDSDLYAQLDPADALGTTFALTQPGCVGEGIRAGLWAGARKDDVPTAMLFDRGGVAPGVAAGAPYQGYPVWYASQPFLKLDMNGRRFCNESAPYDVSLHMLASSKDRLEAILFDANAWTEIESFDTISCSRLVESPTEPPTGEGVGEDVFWGWVQEGVEMGIVFKCDTVEELAEKLGLPVDAVTASVERYNASAQAGVDEEFGKPAKDLFALDTAPFYGAIIGSWTLCTLDGLTINDDCQVLSSETGDPIPGLYACGNNSGSFFSNNYPELFPGVACGRGMTEARHATLHALGKLD